MVALKKRNWFSEITGRKSGYHATGEDGPKKSGNLGILAFETGRTMSKLVALYKSLSDGEFHSMTNEVLRSEGISYLNSMDQGFLMSLACAEKLEDLDRAASVAIRLSGKCRDAGLTRFDMVYTDLKLGIVDFRKLTYGSRDIEKIVGKMEKLVAATANLFSSQDELSGLEISEKKMKGWKDQSKPNISHFLHKLEQKRKQVQHFREISLWSKTFDKSVGLIGRVVCFVYARICSVFSAYVPILSSVLLRNARSSHHKNDNKVRFQPEVCLLEPILKEQIRLNCGSVSPNSTSKPMMVRFYSQKSMYILPGQNAFDSSKNNRVFHAAGPATVGGSGLALRYANVILMAEKCMYSGESVDVDTRRSMYEMLPENMKSLVKAKLCKNMKESADDEYDESMARGWREAMAGILGWLAPMADDTVEWHLERNNFDRMRLFESKPPVLLLQTLHFSDKEKTEAAIAAVLVSLSCVCKHENRWHRTSILEK